MSKDITDELIIREETSGYSFEKSKGDKEKDIKNLTEIINLCNEELDNEDENVTAVLDLVDLKSLRNLIKAYKEQNDIIKTANIAIKDLQEKLKNYIPVSLVEEKIEKLKNEDLEIYDTDSEDLIIAKYEQRAILDFLQELLEKR